MPFIYLKTHKIGSTLSVAVTYQMYVLCQNILCSPSPVFAII